MSRRHCVPRRIRRERVRFALDLGPFERRMQHRAPDAIPRDCKSADITVQCAQYLRRVTLENGSGTLHHSAIAPKWWGRWEWPMGMSKGAVPLFRQMPLNTRVVPKDCPAFAKQCRASRPPRTLFRSAGKSGAIDGVFRRPEAVAPPIRTNWRRTSHPRVITTDRGEVQ